MSDLLNLELFRFFIFVCVSLSKLGFSRILLNFLIHFSKVIHYIISFLKYLSDLQ